MKKMLSGRISLVRLLSALLIGTLLLGALSACDAPEEAASPTRVPRSTRVPKPSAVASAATARPSTAGADWTVLVYLDGDNDLEAAAVDDFAEMARVGSSDKLNIIAQMDRIASDEDWDTASYGDWETVKRFRVEQKQRPLAKNQLADLGELNMGDPKTLVDFVTWGIKSYPAQHYALIFWDHGAAWPGITSDDTSDGDMITLPELVKALGTIQQRTSVQKLDLIGFDACLMGQIDVLGSVAPFGQVAIGSADLEPGEGWAWNAWLADLAKNTNQTAADIAPRIIKSFISFYKREDEDSVTLSAFDLNKVAKITSAFDTLAGAMIAEMDSSYDAIAASRSYAAEYASGDEDISAIDLGYFAQSLLEEGAGGKIEQAAEALSEAIKSARIANGYGSDHPDSSGISVYFPWTSDTYDTSYTKSSPLTKESHWDEFLKAFYKAGDSSAKRSKISKPEVSSQTVTSDSPLTLEATVSGDDTAYVYYFVGAIDPNDPNKLQVQFLDYIYPPGATPNGAAPSWPAGGSDVRLTWPATSWYLGNGNDVIGVPFSPLEYGSHVYSVEGTYTSKKTGKETPVSLEFEVSQGRGRLLRIWSFTQTSSATRPRELKPRAGDTFTPGITTYTDTGNDLVEETVAGDPITFGADPLVAFESSAPGGDYVIGLMVENIAGEISDQYADVTVENTASGAQPEPPAAPATEFDPRTGVRSYHDQKLGFRIDYPQNWQPFDTGNDKVVFYNPETQDAYLAVDVYGLEGASEQANQAIIQELLDSVKDEPGFAVQTAAAPVQLAGRDGLKVEYVYKDRDGTLLQATGIAVSDSTVGATYLLTSEVGESAAASNAARLTMMLASFGIEGS